MYLGSAGVLSAWAIRLPEFGNVFNQMHVDSQLENLRRLCSMSDTRLAVLSLSSMGTHYERVGAEIGGHLGFLIAASGTMRQPLGSSLLLSQLHHHFTHPTPTRAFPLSLLPRHLISKRDPTPEPGIQPKPILRDDRAPQTTASWQHWAQEGVVEGWKEASGEIINYRGFDFQTARDLPQALYEFPDGYHQYFGEERYRFTEMLFDPKNYFNQVSLVTAGDHKTVLMGGPVNRTSRTTTDSPIHFSIPFSQRPRPPLSACSRLNHGMRRRCASRITAEHRRCGEHLADSRSVRAARRRASRSDAKRGFLALQLKTYR